MSSIAGGVHHALGTIISLCPSHHTFMAGALMASTRIRSDNDVVCMLAVISVLC